MSSHKLGKTFRKTLLVYFFVLLIPFIILSIFLINEFKYQRSEENMDEWSIRSSAIAAALDSKFIDTTKLGEGLAKTLWVKHASSEGSTSDFTATRKSEICTDLANYQSFLEVADHVAVYFPQTHTVVNQQDWWEENAFLDEIGIPDLDATQKQHILEEFQNVDAFLAQRLEYFGIAEGYTPTIVCAQSLNATKDKAIMLVIIPISRMSEYMERFFGNIPTWIDATNSGNPLYAYYDERLETIESRMNSFSTSQLGFDYMIFSTELEPHILRSFPLIQVSYFCTAGLLAFLLAYLFARISYRPVNNLLVRLGIGEDSLLQEDMNVSMEDSLNDFLLQESSLQSAANQYQTHSRNNFLCRLLEGSYPSENLEKYLRLYMLPYSPESWVQVVLIQCEEDAAGVGNLEVYVTLKTFFEEEMSDAKTVELVTLTESTFACVLHFLSENELTDFCWQITFLKEYLIEERHFAVTVCCGDTARGVAGIHESYRNAVEEVSPSPIPPKRLPQ